MKVKTWGTRGSIAIANPQSAKAGGNTTCYEVISDCFPENNHVMLDTGTGFVPAGWHYLREEPHPDISYTLLYTHWHWDHILGLTLSPPTFINQIPMTLYGPWDAGIGPKEMVQYLFKRPFFPVDSARFLHKMRFETLYDYDVKVIISHREGGFSTMNLSLFNHLIKDNKQIPVNGKKYALKECMVIRMAKANHGNSNCISYRFEEMPTGKTFVFCTDHEDMTGIPSDFNKHLSDADLLIIDAQYNDEKYMKQTAGFGHGTPFGAIKQGMQARVQRVGLTHHDPMSTDDFLESSILEEGWSALETLVASTPPGDASCSGLLGQDDIFLCRDYDEIEV